LKLANTIHRIGKKMMNPTAQAAIVVTSERVTEVRLAIA
jgi:hypothetical protein